MFECIKRIFKKNRILKKKRSAKKKVDENSVPNNSDDPKWLKIALDELGVHERPGRSNEKRILEYHDHTTLNASEDAVAWCSSFMCFVMEKSGNGSTRSAAARSWLKYGIKCEAKRGAICIFKRGKSWQGHVALYVGENEKQIFVLGGNQGDAVTIKAYPKSKLLDMRWPNLRSGPRP